MPIENFGIRHFTPQQKQEIDNALALLEAALRPVAQNLTEEDRQRYGSINEQNKLFANKVMDYSRTEPQLRSPDVNWPEFEASTMTLMPSTNFLIFAYVAKKPSSAHTKL